MADQRIVLQYDPTEAVASSARANKAIESNEKTAERAGAAIAKVRFDDSQTNVAALITATTNAGYPSGVSQ